MAQTRDARSARIEQARSNIKFALTCKMNQEETLGLESLGIEKPGKTARRKAKAQTKLGDQNSAISNQSTDAFNQHDTMMEAWRLPTVPSYQSLPIPPLGSSTSHWTNQPASSFDPNARRATPNFASYRYPQNCVFSDTQGAARYQPEQGFTPVNAPSAAVHQPRTQVIQNRDSFTRPVSVVSAVQKRFGPEPTIQNPPLSVLSYHRLRSLRIDKQYRHSKTRLPSESTSSPLGRWTGSPPRTVQQSVAQPVQPPQFRSAKSTPPVIRNHPPLIKDGLIHLPAPLPTPTYLRLAHATPSLLSSPQRLLLILDLNGTLLYRSGHIQYSPRPCLKRFLHYALVNHSVLIWSSATPKNVKGMCEKLFNPVQRQLLLGEWARDTLDLTPNQYKERVQVYKRLDRVWANEAFQYAHPGFEKGERWGQHNTLLIDDNMMKASAQPYNHVEVPESVQGAKEGDRAVLEQVVGYLEYARRWNDVSGFLREMKFGVREGWGWDWAKGAAYEPERITDDEDDDGGVKL